MMKLNPAVPAAASTNIISCVEYAMDDNASEAKTARPTPFPIVSCASASVANGFPMRSRSMIANGRGFSAVASDS